MEALLKYYSVPSLSMRSALHRLLSEQAWLVDQMWVAKDPHPTCIGYAYALSRSLHIALLDAHNLQDLGAGKQSASCKHDLGVSSVQ